MKLLDSIKAAIRSVAANKLRSSLTVLGIIIGVGSVIVLMSVGRGAQSTISTTIQKLGSNIIYIQPRNPDAPDVAGLSSMFASSPTLTLTDAEAISRVPGVTSIAPVNENFIRVYAGSASVVAVLDGSTPEYLAMFSYRLASGQFISERHVAARDTVVVLGSRTAKSLFGNTHPVGQIVKIKEKRFTVIGLLAAKGGAVLGISMDDVAVIPITTFQTRVFYQRTAGGEDAVESVAIHVDESSRVEAVKSEIQSVLRKEHRLMVKEKDDFAVVSQEQILGIFNQITNIFTIFLGSIASISLIVGGIGIMNIMLVSVTERTREIGIRKAVGAKRRDILLQFLFEAAVLSLTGGAVGIAGGWIVSRLVSRVQAGGIVLNTVVAPDIVILALSVSVIIGLLSGMYPAIKASRMNPIEALRYG